MDRWKEVHPLARIKNLASLYWLVLGQFCKRCCPIARVMGHNLRNAVCLAGLGKIRAILTKMIFPDWLGNMLLNVILQPLGCKLIYDIAVVMGR